MIRARHIITVLVAAGVFAVASACHDVTICAGVEIERLTLPDTVTIKVDAETIAIAGEASGACDGGRQTPPRRQYTWRVSDSTVVAVSPIDSLTAYIRGLRPGQAFVTPVYVARGDPIEPVSVTVVP